MTTARNASEAFAAALRERIRRDGPIRLDELMVLAGDVYYQRRDVLGSAGDFITAPEISQVFGELVGLWCAVVWQRMGRPSPFNLVECGPGRGTLMADLLRATSGISGFTDAADIHLVERSETLRAAQRSAVVHHRVTWHDDIAGLPAGPSIVVANEFADALPVRQCVYGKDGWRERHVALDGDAFVFIDVASDAPVPAGLIPAVGDVFEHSPAAATWLGTLAARVTRDGGGVLVIDYGHSDQAFGDTLQAVKRHKFHGVLSDLGAADLTAHVDFAALGAAARAAGATVLGPVPQGTWLSRLGIALRIAQLTRGRDASRAGEIAAAARRLTTPEGMGLLFKVLAVVHPSLADPLAPLDGFAQDTAP